MLIKIYPDNPSRKTIAHVAEVLRADGVIIYPTDGVYAYGCSIRSAKGIERLKRIKNKSENEFSIMCADISGISDYAKVDTPVFKVLREHLPGPFTFILRASSRVPDKVMVRRKTIGVRMADNNIAAAIVRELGAPLVTSSVKEHNDETEYLLDPELIQQQWGMEVDMVIDGGYGSNVPTTVVDLSTDGEFEILRQGGGDFKDGDNNFWQDAARGGLVIGGIAIAVAVGKTFAGGAGLIFSLVELIAVAYCLFTFGKKRGEQTYGQAMGFILAQMMLAGVIYGVGYYFLVNFWAVDFFTQQMARAWEVVGEGTKGVDKATVYKMWASPAVWVIYGVLAEVIYGGVIGLFIAPFYRKRL